MKYYIITHHLHHHRTALLPLTLFQQRQTGQTPLSPSISNRSVSVIFITGLSGQIPQFSVEKLNQYSRLPFMVMCCVI